MRIDSGWVAALLAVLGFAFACVGVLGQWRVSRNTTALTQYRETAQALEGKARAQEAEIADLRADAHKKDTKIAELEGKLAVLQDTLTGRASWDILDHKISEALQIAADNRTEIRMVHELIKAGRPS